MTFSANWITKGSQIVALAAGYVLLGWVVTLSIPATDTGAALWPSAGLALVALLRYGNRLWPAVLLGSLSFSGWHAWHNDQLAMVSVMTAVSAIGHAVGATLQALLGASMARRSIDLPNDFDSEIDVTKFLVITGPLTCLTDATWSVTLKWLTGALQANDYLSSWIAWWLRDSFATIMIAPALLPFLNPQRQVRWRRLLSVSAPVLGLTIVSAWSFSAMRDWGQNKAHYEFQQQASALSQALHKSFDAHLALLTSVERYFAGTDELTREEFDTFAPAIVAGNRAIQALEWVPYVPAAERQRYEQRARQEGSANFEFTERTPQGELVRAQPRPEYYPVYFAAPSQASEAVMGYDLGSSPARLAALTAARDHMAATASERVHLAQERGGQFGLLVFQPIFARATVQRPRRDLRGFALAVIRIDELVESAIGHLRRNNVALEIFDDSAEDDDTRLLYAARRAHRATTDERRWVTTPKFAGREWKIVFRSTTATGGDIFSRQESTVLLSGTLLTAMVGMFLLTVTGRSAKVEGLVRARTAELVESNTTLQREISERKSAEIRVSRSEAHVRAVLEAAPNGIVTIDDGGKIESINPAAEYMFGYSAAQITGKPARTLFFGPYQSLFENRLGLYEESSWQKSHSNANEFQGQRRDGGRFPVEVSLSALRLDDKPIFIGILHDISEQKQFQADLAQAKDSAEHANRAKSEFLASMSHEIRTPMNAIIGMAELLRETPLNAEQQEYVNTFAGAGEALLDLINDILELSKIEAGQVELERRAFDIEELIDKTVDLLAPRGRAKGVEVSHRLGADVPRLLSGDAARLRQVLFNLLDNAIKFTADGRVALEGDCLEPPVDAQCRLRFSVRDTGIGVPEDQKLAIFDRFTQADASATRRFGGTGLGLAICKKFCALMGGEIWVENNPDRGSTFHFTARFGIDRDALPVTGPAPALSAVPALVAVGKPPLRILLVDDVADNRKLIQAFLKSGPFAIDTAENGAIAVDKFIAQGFDLVLMDMQMPVMDGYDATRAIRQWEQQQGHAATPIVALTAHALAEDTDRSLRAGCTAHVTKPIKKVKLLETIAQYAGGAEL